MRPGLPGISVFVLSAADVEPEFKPFRVLIRRFSGRYEGTPELFEGDDLAGFLGLLGVDVKWPYVADDVRAWLHFGGEDPPRIKPYRRHLDPLGPPGGDDPILAAGITAIRAYSPLPAPPEPPAWRRALRRWWGRLRRGLGYRGFHLRELLRLRG
jgi:hypothetical protein